MNSITIAIPAEIRERIIQAANDLYDQADRNSLPTVDQVRRTARVDMNAASSVMREWRRAQSIQAIPVALRVPDAVVQANNQLLTALWTQAQELANDSLRAAQSGWDSERTELDDMRQELAQAYEIQALEFERFKTQAADTILAHQETAKLVADELSQVKAELAQALIRAERAEAQVNEIERRAADLRSDLDRAKAESVLSLKSATDAREHAAELAGKLSAIQEQNTVLLTRLVMSHDET